MRKIVIMAVIAVQVLFLSGCAAWQNVSYSDDLYSIHNKIAIAERQKREAELAKAQYEAQQAQYEATLAKIKAEAAKQNVTVATEGNVNGFDAVLADSYESAYARRLYAFSSPTYRMPSSYYSLRYSDAFFYASAYDPAFYNIMISGDMVWVEPKYVTSMFGSWGAVSLPAYSWYYGWNDPFYYWGRPYRYGWYYGWNNPYYWGCGYPYHHHHHYHYHHHHGHHHNHYHPHHRPSHNHPPHAGSGSVGNTGHHHNRPGQVVGRNPGASRPVDRGSSVRPSAPSSGRVSQPTYRNSATATSSGKGSSSYRSTGSSSYRSSGSSSSSSSYRSSGSSSSRSYSSPSSSSSMSSGHSSYSGGGGGNSRGR